MALQIAEAYNGTIINADSIQLYKDLGILTAQPDMQELGRAPHKLYGIMPPDIRTDAQSWREMAEKLCRQAHQNERLPILVGGTGFYLKAMVEGLSPIPEIPNAIRKQVSAELKSLGTENFAKNLCTADPKITGKIDLKNPMRLMRAAEVLRATGKSIIDWQTLPKSGPPSGLSFYTIFVMPPRDSLYDRCNRRFDKMLEAGALDQVRDFNKKHPHADEMPISRAIGYKELSAYLNDDLSLEDAKTEAQAQTRHYAKRQTTWFKNQMVADEIVETPDSTPRGLSEFLS